MDMHRRYVDGRIDTAAGEVPRVSSRLTRADRWGGLKAVWSVGRMRYTVEPGLYALGHPDHDAPVFVSANYKLSFDILRQALAGIHGWIVVLDTKGINVWCAAGKGTFGTGELLNRIARTRLGEIVNQRRLVVPQLGAPGVAAHEVKKGSGFSVTYGPIRARDIRAFLDAGMIATPEMRRVTFSLLDRLRLVPVELVGGLKYLVIAAAVFFLLSGLGRSGYSSALALDVGSRSVMNLVLAYLAGVVIGPVLLPWLPGRSFSFKGFVAGLGALAISLLAGFPGHGPIEIAAWILLIPAAASFLTMNFTGSSTYTSLSGVKKEMRMAVPLQIGCGVAGATLWVVSRFL
jgi:hypothetical protein